MAKVVLISDGDGNLGQRLSTIYQKEGAKVVLLSDSNEKTEAPTEGEDLSFVEVSWNKGSIFSAKTVVREALRYFGKIDEVIVLAPERDTLGSVEDISINDIDEKIEKDINGLVYLTREVLDIMGKKKEGTLSFVAGNRSKGSNSSSLHAGAKGFFGEFTESIITKGRSGLFQNGFISGLDNNEGFAEFIYRINSEKNPKANGQWLHHSNKKSIFSSVPVAKRA